MRGNELTQPAVVATLFGRDGYLRSVSDEVTAMRRIGRVSWAVRFGVLAVAALAMLLSTTACDQEPAATEESAVAQQPTPTQTPQPTATPTPTATPVPAATPAPTATPEPTAIPKPTATPAPVRVIMIERHLGSPACVTRTAGIDGDRGVKWSPTVGQIVFTTGGQLYVVGADGVGLRWLSDTTDVSRKTTFDVSPDGRQVVYSTCDWWTDYRTDYRRDTNVGVRIQVYVYEYALVVAGLDGAQARQLTDKNLVRFPSLSPDGKRIAYVSWGSLYSVAADGTDERRLAIGPIAHHPPQWSPDGELIAFVNFEDYDEMNPAIYVVGAEGRDQHYQGLTDTVSGPSWSPDGQRIAFAKADGAGAALYTIAVDGTDERRLATIEGWVPHRGESGPATAWIRKVSWSPDGSKILVLAREADDPEIQIIEADGSGSATLKVQDPSAKSIADAAWSPDGTRIALSGEFRHGDVALVTIGADGSDPLPRVLVWRRADGRLVGRDDISAYAAGCRAGVVVPDPEANPGLVEDCKTLLEVRNALDGPRRLNWRVTTEISEWEGIVVDGSPPRVREVVLAGHLLIGEITLSGEIPPELSRLTELRVLDISYNALLGEILRELGDLKNLEKLNLGRNYLGGEIPPELGGLANLTHLRLQNNRLAGEIPAELGQLTNLRALGLAGNWLTGCVPAALRNVENNDFGGLGLPFC